MWAAYVIARHQNCSMGMSFGRKDGGRRACIVYREARTILW